MKAIQTLFLLILSTTVLAQDDGTIGAGLNNLNSKSAYTAGTWIKNFEDTTIKGNVYLYENWNTVGVIVTSNDINLSIVGLNYDTKNNNFVAKVSEDSVYVFNNKDIKEVKINKNYFKPYKNNKDGSDKYYEVLAMSNDIEILNDNIKVVQKGKLNPITQVTEQDKYVNMPVYYLKMGDKINEIKLKNKSFSKHFGKKEKEIKSFINDKNLSLKDERNFQVILNYYNTL